MTDNKLYDWQEWAIRTYGSLEEAKRIRSEAGKKAKGVPKRTQMKDNPDIARERGRLGASARWSKK